MNSKELYIECIRNKPQNNDSWFCKPCRNKIIYYCWNYHKKLQERFR